jgi:hypothetical protein
MLNKAIKSERRKRRAVSLWRRYASFHNDKIYERRLKRSEDKYPYVNHMNILHEPLQLIDVQALANKCTDKWYNQTLCQVNESVVRLGVLEGEYHWHKHDNED